MTEQKIALITGASSGIGFELTKQLAAKGYKIYAAARRTGPIKPLEEQYRDLIIPVQLDVSDPAQIVALRERFETELPDGKLHILYNNAGQSCTLPALDLTNDAIEQVFKVNVFGPMNLCREMSQFVINSRGTILFTGSVAGLMPFPFGSAYASTKAAIHQYARVLHGEMKLFGVRVINVITGGVKTDIADKRSIPEDSLFNTPEGRPALEYRKHMSDNNHPMSADAYVREVIKDIERSYDPVDVYLGTFSSIAYWIYKFAPYPLLEWVLRRRFKLDGIYNSFKRKNDWFNDQMGHIKRAYVGVPVDLERLLVVRI